MTHTDTNPENWEFFGKYLDMSPAYAYKSDLMRLELLYKYGGIYIDTDVEVVRSFDPLHNYSKPFAAWESVDTVGSAIIGSPPQSLEVLDLILYCIGAIEIESRGGSLQYGGHLKMFSPTVLTRLWRGNDKVSLLKPESFYPYHWNEKHRRYEDFSQNPNTYAVHHWNGSWS